MSLVSLPSSLEKSKVPGSRSSSMVPGHFGPSARVRTTLSFPSYPRSVPTKSSHSVQVWLRVPRGHPRPVEVWDHWLSLVSDRTESPTRLLQTSPAGVHGALSWGLRVLDPGTRVPEGSIPQPSLGVSQGRLRLLPHP